MKAEKLFLLAIASMFFASCEDGGLGDELNAFENSRRQWQELKKANGDSYEYKTIYLSWTGTNSETTITVENGKVTGRRYVYWNSGALEPDATMKTDTLQTYAETSADLGTHADGFEPLTFDAVYDKAKEFLDVDTKTNKLYFETLKNGILKRCGYVPGNCADDCFNGISVDTVIWLK